MQRRAFALADRISAPSDAEDEPFERASAMTVPTLILVGALDVDAIQDAARQWASALPHGTHETWNDVAHLLPLEQPARFADRVGSWMAENEESRNSS